MGHYYHFKRGDPVTVVSGRYKGCIGLVDSAVFQRTVDYPEEYAAGYHVVLDNGIVATVRVEQVVGTSQVHSGPDIHRVTLEDRRLTIFWNMVHGGWYRR